MSSVKSRVATASFPAASAARTRKVWGPSASGSAEPWAPSPEQGPKAGVPSSIEHSSEAPASALKPKVGVGSLVRPSGPESIARVGGVMLTVHPKLAGLPSALPAASTARTSKLWEPSLSSA